MSYYERFRQATAEIGRDDGYPPREYQVRAAEALSARRHVVLRAPTGAGKTLAVLMPFLLEQSQVGARRLIYALPLRTLVQSIHAEATRVAEPFGKIATIQTGSQPEDPFFDRGDLIFTTYDQLLSGYLCGPYGLPGKLHNMNAAAVAGNLVVFDEFHLMDPALAFLTGVHCLRTFFESTVSVWMTATATNPLCDYLKSELNAVEITLDEAEMQAVYRDRGIQRRVRKMGCALSASDILAHPQKRVLAVVNRVARAQDLYREVKAAGREAVLLHSRFFAQDRDRQRREMEKRFGKDALEPAVAIATQVIEAGMDISADVLLTELCPMSALVQRAGRCARFDAQQGEVQVFDVQTAKPYCDSELAAADEAIVEGSELDPNTVSEWVERVHRASDAHEIRTTRARMIDREVLIQSGMERERKGGVSHLIRKSSDTVSVMLCRQPAWIRPCEREMIGLWRTQLNGMSSVWRYDPDAEGLWTRSEGVGDSFVVALDPSVGRYTVSEGLTLYAAGEQESPVTTCRERRDQFCYHAESWRDHTDRVIGRMKHLLKDEVLEGGLLEAAFSREKLERCSVLAAEHHDRGKLQVSWDAWVQRYQSKLDPAYVHSVPLAHTDFDARSARDIAAQRACGLRPPHAAASAFFSTAELRKAGVGRGEWLAIVAAIVGHHGGWFAADRPIARLLPPHEAPEPLPHERINFDKLLGKIWYEFEQYWPLSVVLTRLLRRADQKATADGFQTE